MGILQQRFEFEYDLERAEYAAALVWGRAAKEFILLGGPADGTMLTAELLPDIVRVYDHEGAYHPTLVAGEYRWMPSPEAAAAVLAERDPATIMAVEAARLGREILRETEHQFRGIDDFLQTAEARHEQLLWGLL